MNLIVPIILILASVGVFLGYINPTYTAVSGSVDIASKSVKELQSEEKDYSDAINKTSDIERVHTGLLDRRKTITNDELKKVEKLLPDHIDSVRLIVDINERIAAEYGMSLTNLLVTASGVVPSATSKTAASASAGAAAKDTAPTLNIGPSDRGYDSVKLGFTVTGSYDNFRQFLKELEQSLRIIDITSLSFSTNRSGSAGGSQNALQPPPQPQAGASDVYTYSMTIRTYYLR